MQRRACGGKQQAGTQFALIAEALLSRDSQLKRVPLFSVLPRFEIEVRAPETITIADHQFQVVACAK